MKVLGSRYLPVSPHLHLGTHLTPSDPSFACLSNILLHLDTSLSGLDRSVSLSLELSGFCASAILLYRVCSIYPVNVPVAVNVLRDNREQPETRAENPAGVID
jgi:hypothetical protein